MNQKHIILIVVGAITLVAATAGASAFIMNKKAETPKSSHISQKEEIRWNGAPPVQQQAQQVPKCKDGNVVGAIAGGVGGGIIGSNIGDGKGKTAATIGGALGGAYLGKEYIPTENVTCR